MVGTGLARKGGLIWKIGRVIENFTYRHADKIIVISEDFKKNIMAKGVPEEKIVVVYNWVDQNAVEGVGSGVVPLSLMVPVMVTLRVVTPPPLTVSVAL